MTQEKRLLRCECGEVEVEARGPHLACLSCFCGDCQEAGRRLEALQDAKPARDADGGTPLVLQRKDRFRVVKGSEKLEAHKIRSDSPTNRFVANCCNTPMYLGFDRGPHWVSIFLHRFGEGGPPLEMRISTKSMPDYEAPRDGVPTYPGFPLSLPARLIASRVAMFFSR